MLLVTSDVRFIGKQANIVTHSLAKTGLCHASFRIHITISSCISLLLL